MSRAPNELKKALPGEIYPIHRLDKNVGGVMVYARTKAAAAALSKAVQEGIANSLVIEKVLGCKMKIYTDYNGIGKIQYIHMHCQSLLSFLIRIIMS